jgi:gliding motility-associated-like protein
MLPSAFTPNGDGSNDTLYVKGGPFVKMSFRVYNNWGELLFSSDDQEKGWDGKYKGQPVPLGVYVWILDVDLYNGQSVRKTGDITVLK